MLIKGYSEYYESTVMKSIAVMYDHAIHDLYFDADVITTEDTQTGWTISKESGVNIRTIKSYEQREIEINHAKVNQIKALSLALGCQIEDLLE